jgi:subtilisin family serine protease
MRVSILRVVALALATLCAATVLKAARIGEAVFDEVRLKGKAHVVVMLRDPSLPIPSGVALTDRWSHVPGFAAEIDGGSLLEIAADENVIVADLDRGGKGSDAESLPLIGGNVVQAMGYNGAGIVVAVLDSGVTLTHQDLAGAVVDEQCFCRNSDGSGCCPNGSASQSGAGAARDDNGHGTNVTGIIASRGAVAPIGVAPAAKIVAIKVLDRNNRFDNTSQIVSALDWLVDHHPEVRVVNMSLGTGALFSGYCDGTGASNQAFAAVINTLHDRGVAVFASSGNDASTTSMEAPACVHNTISVAAVYDSDVGLRSFGCTDSTTTADQITCFSDSNATLDLLAPGSLITSTGISGTTSTYMGTSQASPHAAGAAAVLFSAAPALTPDAVEAILKNTGKPLVDPRNGVSAPRIDLLSALQLLRRQPKHRAAAH